MEDGRRELASHRKVGTAAVIIIAGVGFAGFILYRFGTSEDSERARIANPGNSLDAVIVERLMNATAPDFTLVYIVPHHAKVKGATLFSWAFTEGLRVTWSGDDVLLIHADSARVYGEKDYKKKDELRAGGKAIKIRYDVTNMERR